ncbi:MAG: type II toxin-antitoxin system HipA family toxin [Bacteroidales bacterium]|nr:type II toxin-antitoxin system HipA family toxin [Bacteroidales bacterium]
MSDQLTVFADFNFLSEATPVGELFHERIRGNSVYRFHFFPTWLEQHGNTILCGDLANVSGWQYSSDEIFGCLGDALPDRWGRTLIDLREQIDAQAEHRAPRNLTSFDYLCQLDDSTRMGGLRFKRDGEDFFFNSSEKLEIPPITTLRELQQASLHIEEDIEKGETPKDRWIRQLYNPGTSLGGARPKANIRTTDGFLQIAKFPSRNDKIDVGLWEHLCHLLAKEAGILTASTNVIMLGKHHTLLSQRFDRYNSRRIHFASSMALLGFHDGDGAKTGKGYLDIVDFILGHCANAQSNLRELFRRVVFNICIGNADDHFRNHGFLLTPQGWTLSPAYDINPSLSSHQAIMVTDDSNDADLRMLLHHHDDYYINADTAQTIICEVQTAVKKWRSFAKRLHIRPNEVELFQNRIEQCLQ